MYGAFKFLHILGVVLLLGNVTASAVWKVFANRTGHPNIIAFAQRLVTCTDWSLTLVGAVLITGGGYGMVVVAGLSLWAGWLVWGQLLFVVSGVIWLAKLVPLQVAQAGLAAKFDPSGPIAPTYWALCRSWIVWGAIATVPLVVATYVMVVKL